MALCSPLLKNCMQRGKYHLSFFLFFLRYAEIVCEVACSSHGDLLGKAARPRASDANEALQQQGENGEEVKILPRFFRPLGLH